MGRLAIDRVLLEAFRLPWTQRGAFARALAFPAIAMLVLYVPYWWFYDRLEGSMQFVVAAADKLLWIVFAVCCHRLVLIGLPSGEGVRPHWGHRETVFTGWLILLAAAGWLLALPIVTLLVNAQIRSRPSDLDLLVATLAVEVTALSLAYRQLVELRAPPEPA